MSGSGANGMNSHGLGVQSGAFFPPSEPPARGETSWEEGGGAPPPDASEPRWIAAGDWAALLMVDALIVLGFFSHGFALEGAARAWGWMGCACLGAWAAAGWAAGRWDGPAMAPARWLALAWAVALAWTAFQLTPLPAEWVRALSPPWDETLRAMAAADLALPKKIPLAQSPEQGWRSWGQMLAAGMFFAGVYPMASRRAGARRLAFRAAAIALLEGWLGALSLAFAGAARASGAIYNPNHHAVAVFMGMPLVIAGLLAWRRRRLAESEGDLPLSADPALFAFGLAAVALVGGLGSLSRGALAAGALGAAVWMFWERRASFRPVFESDNAGLSGRGAKIALTALAVGLALLLAAAGGLGGDLLKRLDGPSGESTGRLALIRATGRGLAESRFLGLGLGGTESALNRHAEQAVSKVAIWTHCDWVQLPTELGLPGAVLILLALAGLPKAWRQSRLAGDRAFFAEGSWMARAAAAGVLIGLLHAGGDFALRIPLIGFQFLTLAALALAAPAAEEIAWTEPLAQKRRSRSDPFSDSESEREHLSRRRSSRR
jgi:hypothetical protein